MKNLDGRLQAAADLVTPGGFLLDVGTDHGYLPIWLMKQGKIRGAIASDVNLNPLISAKMNIQAAGLSEKIDTRLADGLSGIDLTEVTDIAIAGMGGMLIGDILEARSPLAGKHLILQPMTQAPYLRRWLCRNGYAISAESPAEAGGKFYAVISARYEGSNWECDDFFAHVGKMPDALRSPQKRQLAGQYLKFLQNKLRVILLGMSQSASGDPAAEQYQEIYLQLDELLEREGSL